MARTDLPGFRHLATDDDDPPRPAFARPAFVNTSGGVDDPLVMYRSGAERPPIRRRPSPLVIGGGLVVATAMLLAAPLAPRGAHRGPIPINAGLKATRGAPVNTSVSARRGLPCYVAGVSVGDLPLMDCAARNGVASGSLDARPDRSAIRAAPPPAHVAPARASTRGVVPDRPVARARAGRETEPMARADAHTAAPRLYPQGAALPDEDLLRQPPSPAESAQAARDFYRALGEADGVRAASLVVPEKRRGGPLSAPAIDRFYSSLRAPLRITDLHPLDNRTVAVRYQFVDPEGVVCSGASEVATTVRDGRVLVEGIRTRGRC